nr:unnamed protein product [Digitaria exilis]
MGGEGWAKEGAVARRRVWTLECGGSGGDGDGRRREGPQPPAKRERDFMVEAAPSRSVFPVGPTGSKQWAGDSAS